MLQTLMKDHKSSRCLRTSSTTPGRRVRTRRKRQQSTSYDLAMDQSGILIRLLRAVNEFWVTIQRTEASERCGLSGSYRLKAENDALILKDSKVKKSILVWPYKLLRRYGRDRVRQNLTSFKPQKTKWAIFTSSFTPDEYRKRKLSNLATRCNNWTALKITIF